MKSCQFFCFVFRIRYFPPQIETYSASSSKNCFALFLKSLRLFLANLFAFFCNSIAFLILIQLQFPLPIKPPSTSLIRFAIEDQSYAFLSVRTSRLRFSQCKFSISPRFILFHNPLLNLFPSFSLGFLFCC